MGYALEMNNRPQRLYGIADSPVGLAAWMIDHAIRSYETIARVFEGKPEGLTRDDVLDNVTLYCLLRREGIKIPVAVSAFPDEIYAAPRSRAEQEYPKLIHYNKLQKGGHVAAWEQPALFVSELRASFKSIR